MRRPSLELGTPGGVGTVFVGNLVARGLGFLYPVFLARALGADDFALAYFFINTGFAVGEIVLVGYPTALTRSLAAAPAGERSGWLLSSVIPALPLLGLAIVAGEVLAVRGDGPAGLMSVVVIGLSIDAFYFAILRGLQRFRVLVLYRIGANVAQLALLGIAAALDIVSVPLAAGIFALSYLVPIAIIEARLGFVGGVLHGPLRAGRERMAAMTRFALPAIVSGTAYAGLIGFDVFFMRIFAPGELPDYAAARTLAMPMSLVPYAIGVTLLPATARSEPAEQRRQLVHALALAAALAAAGIVAYLVAAGVLVEVVYPRGYGEAARLLPFLALAVGSAGLYSVLSQWWLGTGRSVPPAIALVIGAGASVAGHLTLTRTYGGAGAAASICLGALVATLLLGWATWRSRRVQPGPPAG